jgi:hypothetical protein
MRGEPVLLYLSDSFSGTRSLFRTVREFPLVWFVIGLGLAQLGLLCLKGLNARRRSLWLQRASVAAGVFVLCAYVFISLSSLHSFMIQLDEANIISIAAASLRGLPMYHPPVSPDFDYALMYGPFTFLIYRASLLVGGVHHFWIMRSAVVLASLGVCATFMALLRRFLSNSTSIALLTLPLSALIQHTEVSLSIRSDIWIVLSSGLTLLSSLLEAELPAILLTGIFGGILVGLKITAAPAVLLPFYLLYRKFGIRAPAFSLLVLIATTLAPFLLPNVSLHNYILWILFTRTDGLSVKSAFANLLFAVFLLGPALLMELYLRRFGLALRDRLPVFLITVACLIIAVLTSKNGSGLHYLWHLLPSIVLYTALAARDIAGTPEERRTLPVYYVAMACLLFTCVYLRRSYEDLMTPGTPAQLASAQQSIHRYLDRYGGRAPVQIGYGSVDYDYRSLLRYVPIYMGQPYSIEGNTGRFETTMLPFPHNVLDHMNHCTNDVWLIPHGQKPFALWVLPDSLRSTFQRDYTIQNTDGVYDAWVCNAKRAH